MENRFKKLLNRETGNLTEQDAELFQPQQPRAPQRPQSREEMFESLRTFKAPYENITEEEESQYNPNEPRNMLANAVNPLLDKYVNPFIEKLPLSKLGLNDNIRVPELSVADRKRFINELTPENMVLNMGVGSIGKVGQGFGKVNVIETAADRIAAKNKANGFGSVKVIDSAGDKIRAAQQSKFNEGAANRILDEAATKNRFQELFGKEFAERKAAASKAIKDSGNLRSVVDEQLQALDSFKQERLNEILRGEK